MKRRTYSNPLSDISNVSTVTKGSQCHTQNVHCRPSDLLNGRRKRRVMCKENWNPILDITDNGIGSQASNKPSNQFLNTVDKQDVMPSLCNNAVSSVVVKESSLTQVHDSCEP
ncbi:hypothetical protein DCAR_0934544 [Daucus carota subsp. sativus]|uniref:Uncharacterized protein n=1 Tax=Daucus carota subsp. sativus TaxID=79200 RepID=A0A175YK34_DAUCS|nr:hypothetical protein DCAR_0934544 [Daucus carota subsp. sativus]